MLLLPPLRLVLHVYTFMLIVLSMGFGDLNSGPFANTATFSSWSHVPSPQWTFPNRFLLCYCLLVGESCCVESVSFYICLLIYAVWGGVVRGNLGESVLSFPYWISGIEFGSSGLVAESLRGPMFIFKISPWNRLSLFPDTVFVIFFIPRRVIRRNGASWTWPGNVWI